MSCTVIVAVATAMNKTDKNPCLCGADSLVVETDNKYHE